MLWPKAGVAAAVLVTTNELRTAIAQRDPGYTSAQWHAVVTGALEPLAIKSAIAVGAWLVFAWVQGRPQRWPRVLATACVGGLFVTTTDSLLTGIAHGSAHYAQTDLAVGIVLWLVELAALAVGTHASTRPADRGAGLDRSGGGPVDLPIESGPR